MQMLNADTFDWKSLISLKGVSIATAAVVLTAGITVASISKSTADSGRVIMGVKSEGVELSGLSENGTRKFFEKVSNDRIKPIKFSYGEQVFTVEPAEINWNAKIEEATREAQSYGRGGSITTNLKDQLRCALNGRNVTLTAAYDENLLNEKLNAIAAQINCQPANAYCQFDGNGNIIKIAGIIGKKLDTAKIAESLKTPLNTLNLTGTINLEPEEIMPFVTTEDIAQIDSVLGQYSTNFNQGDRGDNIALAAESLNEKLVKTGWTFSFNDTVGERTYSAGYKNAGVIINGQSAQDVGGGVCQVSSTLYNAVLLSGLTPTMRTPHYSPSTYVAPGRDATVADGLLDFKFRNDLPHNVYLLAGAYGSTLTISVLGTKADLNGESIQIEREGSAMAPSIYRVFYKDGQVVKEEFLHTDVYNELKPATD